MEIRGTVIQIEMGVQVAKNGGGSYPGTRFSYRDSEGKLVEKAFHSNVFKFNKELKSQLMALKPGMSFSAEVVKENDFWNWKSVVAGTNDPVNSGNNADAAPARTTASPRSTYETPEERAKKQVYIVRQSAISSAISFHANTGTNVSVEDVLKVAKQFEDYVFSGELDDGSPMAMKGDEHEVY